MRGIRKLAVIGAGTMGQGIAQCAAQSGLDVVLFDAVPEALARGDGEIRAMLDKLAEKDKITAADREAALSRLATASTLAEAASGADLVVEAVPESLELKQRIFRELADLAPIDAVLA